MSAEKPRQIAVQILQRHAAREDYIENLLDQALEKTILPPPDRGLLQELTYGAVRWQATLDWLIAQKTQGRPQKTALQILLRLGLYQLFWLDRIPDHAAVHETVELAKRLGSPAQSGFINAILRGYLRERDQTEKRLQELKQTQPALGYAHPEWLCERWRKRWDATTLPRLLEWNNTPPPTYVRMNTLRTDAAGLATKWEQEGVGFERRSWDWTGDGVVFELTSHPGIGALDSYRGGLFYVQDPSTLLAVRELAPQPGETVLDMCAAPGGKTTHIAALMQNRGAVVAQDPQLDRRRLVWENCQRLGVTCVRLAQTPSGEAPETGMIFDRILIDAPCSNTGVIRRRVDLRWRLRPEEIDRLRATQRELLRRAAGLLRKGGTLVYSTCSLEPEENAQLIGEFLAEVPEFKRASERELLPFVEGVDGAYVARLVRG